MPGRQRSSSLAPDVWIRLGEPSGTTVNDASGNGHGGTYVNTPTLGVAGFMPGDPDTGVTFNGTDQYASSMRSAASARTR